VLFPGGSLTFTPQAPPGPSATGAPFTLIERTPPASLAIPRMLRLGLPRTDRKSTRLNSSLRQISYAVFCLKKKENRPDDRHHLSPRNRQRNVETNLMRWSESKRTFLRLVLPRPRRPLARRLFFHPHRHHKH